MGGTGSCGCGEHWRTSENARDEILGNNLLQSYFLLTCLIVTGSHFFLKKINWYLIPLNSHQKRAKKAKTVANNYSSSAKEMNAQKIKLKVLNPFLTV